MSESESFVRENEDPWAEVAECREALEICIHEDTPFAPYARRLLKKLEEEGY